MAALSFLIMLIEFPLPFMPPFMQIDLSEIPALLTAFSLGPGAGVLVELIKNILHLLKSQTAGIGELANFVVGIALVIPAGLIYKWNKSKKGAFLALVVGVVIMAAVASVFNYFVLLPLYARVLGFSTDAVISLGKQANHLIVDLKTLIAYGIIPFNIIKGFIVSVIVLVVYKRLSPVLHK
ncbi:ECF transporter S component [Candidatus Formimonas warabiya]|uniref:Riboflavin transporter n=2 Tax=Formimonas warabiya TaxID=1761012 RepID=A0A3G1L0V3_FORW1|nr:ECF transporter S component [Candidatus Formimonas warabiya]